MTTSSSITGDGATDNEATTTAQAEGGGTISGRILFLLLEGRRRYRRCTITNPYDSKLLLTSSTA